MALTDEFSKKREKKLEKQKAALEKQVFAPLHKLGLYNYALSSYEDFMNSSALEQSQTTRNAFLLHFMSYLDDYKTYELTPESIEDMMSSISLQSTNLLLKHAPQYLRKLGAKKQIPDELVTASIAAPSVKEKSSTNYSGLIGIEAATLIFQSKHLYENTSDFHNPRTPAHAKALHLAQISQNMDSIIAFLSYYSEHEQEDIDPNVIAFTKREMEHVKNLLPKGRGTILENIVNDKYKVIKSALQLSSPSNSADHISPEPPEA